MSDQLTFPQPTMKAGDELYGFQVLRVKTFPEIRVTAYEIEHKKQALKSCTYTHSIVKIYTQSGFVLHPQTQRGCLIFWNTQYWPAQKNIRLKTFLKN